MKNLFPILSILLIIACTARNSKMANIGKQTSSINEQEVKLSIPPDSFQLTKRLDNKCFFVKDTTQYSPYFLQTFWEMRGTYDTAILVESNLHIRSKVNTGKKEISVHHSVKLPDMLSINSKIQYETIRNDSIFNLSVLRTNLTNLDYQFLINSKLVKSGTAFLNPSFFLAGEPSFDTSDGSEFWIVFYLDRTDCYVNLGIEDKSASRAVLNIFDEQQKNYKNIPTLKRK